MTQPILALIAKGVVGFAVLAAGITATLFYVWGNRSTTWLMVGVPWVIGIVVGLLVARAGPPATPRESPLSQRSVPALAGMGLIVAAVVKSDRVMSALGVLLLAPMVAGLFALLGRFFAIRLGLDNKPSTEP